LYIYYLPVSGVSETFSVSKVVSIVSLGTTLVMIELLDMFSIFIDKADLCISLELCNVFAFSNNVVANITSVKNKTIYVCK